MSNGADVVDAGNRAVTQPANKALGYGDKATGQATRVAQAPRRKKRPRAKVPPHVVLAQQECANLPDTITMTLGGKKVTRSLKALKRSVRVADLADYAKVSPAVVKVGFAAWTSSGSCIWVSNTVTDADAMRAVMYHEMLHIVQFRANGGAPPSSHGEMVRFECDAYTDTADWLANPANHPDHPGVDAYEPDMRKTGDKYCDRLKAVKKLGKKKRASALKTFLENEGLPAVDNIRDLYPKPANKCGP